MEVFRLELVEMKKRTLWSAGAVDEFSEVAGDAAGEIVLVGLTEEEASSWRGLEELRCEQAAKTVGRHKETLEGVVSLCEYLNRIRLT